MSSINYTCKQGERWDLITYKMYGSLANMPDIINANTLVPLDPILPEGTRLVIPILDVTTDNIISTDVPPWKR